jgi:uncharacterized Zn finger protein (UPF0148 family)
MTVEEPSQCPDCGHLAVYDYNGIPVCQDCYQRSVEIYEFRDRLQSIKLTANSEEEQQVADDLIAQVLASISDEDIEAELERVRTAEKAAEAAKESTE